MISYLIKEIQEICEDNTKTIKDKIDCLDQFKEQVNNEYGKAKAEITKNYEHCPFCNNYYLKENFNISEKLIEKYITPDPYVGGGVVQVAHASYFEKAEFKERTYQCPKGHIFTTETPYPPYCIQEYLNEE